MNAAMSIALLDLRGSFSRSSSSIATYVPFSYSYPRTTSPHATSWSPSWHQRLFLMRLLCSGHRRLNETFEVLSVARYRRTGMATIPKLSTPRQMDLGTCRLPAVSVPTRGLPRADYTTVSTTQGGCVIAPPHAQPVLRSRLPELTLRTAAVRRAATLAHISNVA